MNAVSAIYLVLSAKYYLKRHVSTFTPAVSYQVLYGTTNVTLSKQFGSTQLTPSSYGSDVRFIIIKILFTLRL